MKRIGVLIPSSNTTVEKEFSKALRDVDVSLHFSRMPLKNVTINDLSAMQKESIAAAELLKDAEVDLLVFACTSGSFYENQAKRQMFTQKLAKATCMPVVETATAVIQSLKALKVENIALATPYLEEVNRREVAFLNENDFNVVNVSSLGLRENRVIGQLGTEDAVKLGERANCEGAEALFVSCTNFATFEAIPILERKLKKPVISSNSATIGATLKALKIETYLALGKLFGS